MGDFAKQRQNLVQNYIVPVVNEARVVEAFKKVPREKFVPENLRNLAYLDQPLPIGESQTISQPSLVAQMTEALKSQPTNKILEIGTGSGYQAAILAEIVAEVFTIERLEPLVNSAQATLKKLGYDNVHVKAGDGSKGWPKNAPYDGIIVTAAAPSIPQPLVDQLKDGGRLVIPVGKNQFLQEIKIGTKKNSQLELKTFMPVRFVPLIGEHGWAAA